MGITVPVICAAFSWASHRINSATRLGLSHLEKSASGMALRFAGVSMVPGRITLRGKIRIGVFQRDGLHQSGERGFESDVSTQIGLGLFCGEAANRHDSAVLRFTQVRNGFAENVKRRGQVQILHTFPGGVIGGRDGLSAGKAAEDMDQDVEAPEFGDDFREGLANLLRIGKIDGDGAKIGAGNSVESACRDAPITWSPCCRKDSVTNVPRPPFAPVMKTILSLMCVMPPDGRCLSECGERKKVMGRTRPYLPLHHTIVTPTHTTAMPSQRFRLMRSPRNALAPNAPAA